MAGGIEMMLNQALKGLGLNPEQIAGLATELQDGITTMLRQQELILRNQRKIMRELNIPFEEQENGPQLIDHGDGGKQRTGTDD